MEVANDSVAIGDASKVIDVSEEIIDVEIHSYIIGSLIHIAGRIIRTLTHIPNGLVEAWVGGYPCLSRF